MRTYKVNVVFHKGQSAESKYECITVQANSQDEACKIVTEMYEDTRTPVWRATAWQV